MKNNLILLLIVAALLGACNKDETKFSKNEFLVFGHFHGECLGERCVEIFKLEHDKVSEDSNDRYPTTELYKGSYDEMDNASYKAVKDLPDFFPSELLNETESRLGCPDCADQGGLYIEYKFDGVHESWIIDKRKDDIPAYLHEFVDEVLDRIERISD